MLLKNIFKNLLIWFDSCATFLLHGLLLLPEEKVSRSRYKGLWFLGYGCCSVSLLFLEKDPYELPNAAGLVIISLLAYFGFRSLWLYNYSKVEGLLELEIPHMEDPGVDFDVILLQRNTRFKLDLDPITFLGYSGPHEIVERDEGGITVVSYSEVEGSETEVEFKYSLNREAYDKLREFSRGEGVFVSEAYMENTYFDTVDLELSQRKYMLRLRSCGGYYVLTYKRSLSFEDGLQRCKEIECELNPTQASYLLENLDSIPKLQYEPLVEFTKDWGDISSLNFISLGTLSNTRTKFSCKGSNHLYELDEMEYFGRTDYEIECETDCVFDAQKELVALFDRLGVEYTGSTSSKSARFVEAYKESLK